MDILDVMDLLDVGHPLVTRESSPLLDETGEMEPNNLTQSAARMTETLTTTGGETATATQNFTERNLELKLPVLSSSSSESESEGAGNPTAGTSAGLDGERAASPPPNCAICLGRCKNKCFTDSCMHQFCFKCLCEWSKVKPECPLCKQTFKSIIHNVKSIHQFEEYHVQPPTVQIANPSFEMDIFVHNRIQAWNGSTYRPYYFESSAFARGALPSASGSNSNRPNSSNGSGIRNQYVYRGELLDLYRQEYPGAIANSGTLSQLWRRYVYDRKLYAMPVADITGRFRESSARFYRDNPSQVHRLMPWINRDIVCLLRQSQHDVSAVMESINSALTIMNILSPAFRRRLQPFLSTKTAHFIHELNNFARSPYDMVGYDRAVQYSPQTNNEEIVIEFTSSDESTDNDQIDVASDGGNNNNNNTTSTSARTRSTINAINLTIHNRLTSTSTNTAASRVGGNNVGNNGSGLGDIPDDVGLVIDLRGESDNNETTSTAQATNNSSNYLNGQNATSTSESDMITSGTQPTVSENIELTSGSSDECEFVLERKPPHLRTPEMVSLDSASDSDVVFVDESKALNKTTFSSSEGEFNEDPNDHKHYSRHHNKIAALVEAKKRNQSSNLVKSEQQDSHTEVYNMGASTSAALRLSLQKQVDNKSHRSDGLVSSSKRLRRNKYRSSKTDSQARAEQGTSKRRGKRLDSESSHSSTSSSTTTISSSSTTTSSSQSSSSSSDEDYVASFQRKKDGETGMHKRGRKVRKTKKRKASTSNNRRTARKKKNNNFSSDDDDDDDDENGHMGKNFALVMAVNERRKRQNQKKSSKPEENQEEESEGENSWRLKAVNEPLRKQQQQRAKSSNKTNERKRQHKQPKELINNRKRQKHENQTTPPPPEKETQNAKNFYNSDNTTSDESDNINLIQLKTKLIGQDYRQEPNVRQTNPNQVIETETETETALKRGNETMTANDNNSETDISGSVTSTCPNTATATTISTSIPTGHNGGTATEMLSSCSSTAAVNKRNETSNNIAEAMTAPNDLFQFSDDSNDSIQNDHDDHVDNIDSNNRNSIDQQHLLASSSNNNYHDNNRDNCSHLNNDDDDDDDDDNDDNEDDGDAGDNEALRNVNTNMNLNESNVFADGTSMSTTTTDTILHETAEQISSSAVNFYTPQQTFNTADFADDNSTNSSSSSSDSSMSSSTTSLSSSSNISSTNSHSYSNYDRS